MSPQVIYRFLGVWNKNQWRGPYGPRHTSVIQFTEALHAIP